MYRMTIKGKPYGPIFPTEKSVIEAVVRNWGCMHHLGWKKVSV